MDLSLYNLFIKLEEMLDFDVWNWNVMYSGSGVGKPLVS